MTPTACGFIPDLFQTPVIANSFALDGVVTLVDAKNILPRLREGEDDGGENKGEEEIDEAFQQIMFSDRIVVNKVRGERGPLLAGLLRTAGLCRYTAGQTRLPCLVRKATSKDCFV